jgi:hypothetical protein
MIFPSSTIPFPFGCPVQKPSLAADGKYRPFYQCPAADEELPFSRRETGRIVAQEWKQ